MNQELKQQFVNHYADFLCDKITKNNYKTVIQVTHCNHFIIINGESEAPETFKTYDSEFLEQFGNLYFDEVPQGLKVFNLIYPNKEPKSVSELSLNEPYLNQIIKDTIDYATSSQFPHGFSMNCGRNLFYYLQYISTNLQGFMGIKKLSLSYFTNEVEDEKLFVICDGFIPNKVKSIILDYFDYEEFNEKLKDYDILNDFIETFEKPHQLKDIVGKIEVF